MANLRFLFRITKKNSDYSVSFHIYYILRLRKYIYHSVFSKSYDTSSLNNSQHTIMSLCNMLTFLTRYMVCVDVSIYKRCWVVIIFLFVFVRFSITSRSLFARFSFVFRSSLVRHSFADKEPIEKRTRKQRKNSEMTTRTRRRWVEVATNSQLSNRRHHPVIVIPVLRHLQGVCGELIRHVVHCKLEPKKWLQGAVFASANHKTARARTY